MNPKQYSLFCHPRKYNMSGLYKVLITTTITRLGPPMMTSVVVDFDCEMGAEIAIEKLEESNGEEGYYVRATRLYRTQSESGL